MLLYEPSFTKYYFQISCTVLIFCEWAENPLKQEYISDGVEQTNGPRH